MLTNVTRGPRSGDVGFIYEADIVLKVARRSCIGLAIKLVRDEIKAVVKAGGTLTLELARIRASSTRFRLILRSNLISTTIDAALPLFLFRGVVFSPFFFPFTLCVFFPFHGRSMFCTLHALFFSSRFAAL